MGKIKQSIEEKQAAERAETVATLRDALKFAEEAARSVFDTNEPDDAMVDGIFARTYEYDEAGKQAVCEDLAESILHLREAQGCEPSVGRVFATFDLLFKEKDDE